MSRRGAKKKPAPPPPNQADIRSFISGSSNWKAGDSPLTPQEQKQKTDYLEDPENAEKNHLKEAEIHRRILAAGTFNYFKNQQAALAYLNGQFLLRKSQEAKIKAFEKYVENFEKSGLTKRFLKIPTKLLPQDRSNCEREVVRANKLVAYLNLFKEELIKLKYNCLDETKSVKSKKEEEFEYFSEKVLEMNHLKARIRNIGSKLNHTNIQINKSSGLFTKYVSILENKRIMRRKKENSKDERKDAFKRNVASLTTFLPKYCNLEFKDAFKIHEDKVIASKNQYTGVSNSNNSGRSESGRSGRNKDTVSDDVEIEVHDTSEKDLEEEDGDKDVEEEDGDKDMEEVMVVADQSDGTSDQEDDVDHNMNSINNRTVKYIHEKIVRTIKPTKKLGEENFKSQEFTGKDLKALRLLLELGAVQDSLVDVIQSFVNEKETEIDSSRAEVAEDSIVINSEEPEAEQIDSIVINSEEPEEEQMDSIVINSEEPEEEQMLNNQMSSLRKLYKKAVRSVMEENDNKLKLKKLKKKVFELSEEFDDLDSVARQARVEKYIQKVKGLIIVGKYAIVQ